jgi:hypothetical protein
LSITYIPVRRVVLTALARVFGSRDLVIAVTLAIGVGLFVWGRVQLSGMFERSETGEIVFGVDRADAACSAPSLYLMPDEAREGSYLAVVDMLGGGIGDRSIMNIGKPALALAYSGDGSDALAAARAAPEDCRHMEFSIGGGGVAVTPASEADAALANAGWSTAVTLAAGENGAHIAFDLADGAEEDAARTAFRLDGVRDVWQFGYRRVNLWNGRKALPVNVFLLGASGYAFLSDTYEPIKVPVRTRSAVAVHLAAPGAEAGNAYQVYSRLVDYDARLQSRLLTVSTIFGIGISLMVEGAILVLLRIARRIAPHRAAGMHKDED